MAGNDSTTPTLVKHAEWLKGTSMLLRTRSTALRAVDNELLLYERTPSVMQLAKLKQAFAAWKASKGDDDTWKGSGRNKNELITLLDAELSGGADNDALRGTPSFMDPALINARLGVIYLFGKLDCSDSIFKIVLNGALDVTSAGMDFGDVGDVGEKIGTGLEKSRDLMSKAADKVENKIRSRKGEQTVSSDQLIDAPVKLPASERIQRMWQSLRETIYQFGLKVIELIRAQLAAAREKITGMIADPGQALLDNLPGVLRKICDFLAGKFLAAAAPFIGAGLDIAKGVANTVDSGITKFKEWLQGRDVAVLAGHPGTIIQAIRRAMWFSIGAGLYDTLKGGLKLGLEFASSGASAIGSLVVSLVEAVVKTIWKLIEIVRMRGFFKQARELWIVRGEANALHTRPIAFNNWFKSYAVDMPALSVLALNTGICGDKQHFLQMYKGDDNIVSQNEFDAGCKYVDELKVWGTGYLNDCGYNFTSADPVVEGLLKMAQSHSKELGTGEKAWKFTLGFLNA